ncbi:hypothetical protein Bbelb_403440 [Branchiostoma belcheri]|nr:hypothetical protein Bbelb_403440 [Branchiostoma belcheri]
MPDRRSWACGRIPTTAPPGCEKHALPYLTPQGAPAEYLHNSTCRRPTNEGARGPLQGSVTATFNCDHYSRCRTDPRARPGRGRSLDQETGRPGFDSGSYPNKSEHAPRRCALGKGEEMLLQFYSVTRNPVGIQMKGAFGAANQASITALWGGGVFFAQTLGRRQQKTKRNTGSHRIQGNQLEIGPWYNSPVLGKGQGRKITSRREAAGKQFTERVCVRDVI